MRIISCFDKKKTLAIRGLRVKLFNHKEKSRVRGQDAIRWILDCKHKISYPPASTKHIRPLPTISMVQHFFPRSRCFGEACKNERIKTEELDNTSAKPSIAADSFQQKSLLITSGHQHRSTKANLYECT
jgi:hypothetical protein